MVRTKTPGRLSSRSSDFHATSELNRSAGRSLGGAGALAFLVLQGLLAGETVVGFEDRQTLDSLERFRLQRPHLLVHQRGTEASVGARASDAPPAWRRCRRI